jgi:hypothetical protein
MCHRGKGGQAWRIDHSHDNLFHRFWTALSRCRILHTSSDKGLANSEKGRFRRRVIAAVVVQAFPDLLLERA